MTMSLDCKNVQTSKSSDAGKETSETRSGEVGKDGCSDAELRQQVYNLARTILGITRTVEAALINIKTVSAMLNRISDKLKMEGLLDKEEQDLLELTETWLNKETTKTNGIARYLNYTDSPFDKTSASVIPTDATIKEGSRLVSARNSITCMQTGDNLDDEGDELDWDGNGVELSESFHSKYSSCPKTSSFMDPFASGFMLSSGSDRSDTTISRPSVIMAVTKSCSYEGIYEEEMEMTLEFEEGFYSDSSSSPIEKPGLDFSPQADSGVTQLDCNTSTERSLSHHEVELSLEHSSTSYNKDINTWDIFATVNVEDDLQSTASDSNTSTPQKTRKKYASLSTPETSPKHNIPMIQTIEHSKPSHLNYTTTAVTLSSPIKKDISIANANSLSPQRAKNHCANHGSLPELRQQLEPSLMSDSHHTGDDDNIVKSMNDVQGINSLNDSEYSKFELKSRGMFNGKADSEVPESIRRNNYYKRSRKAVLV